MRILGLDPSLSSFGVFERDLKTGVENVLVISTKPKDFSNRFSRIESILGTISQTVKLKRVKLVAIEGYSMQSRGRALSGLVELGYRVRMHLYHSGIPFVEVAPATMKAFFTGVACADKVRVYEKVVPMLNKATRKVIGELNKTQRYDASDAAGLGLMAAMVVASHKDTENKHILKLRGAIVEGIAENED